MKYIQIPDDGIIEKQIMSGEDLIGVCRIDLSYLPAEDVAPVAHGKWEEIFWGNMSFSKCSNCGSKVQWYLAEQFAYCPFCGAKMENEKDVD